MEPAFSIFAFQKISLSALASVPIRISGHQIPGGYSGITAAGFPATVSPFLAPILHWSPATIPDQGDRFTFETKNHHLT